jgi:hypothetical protein
VSINRLSVPATFQLMPFHIASSAPPATMQKSGPAQEMLPKSPGVPGADAIDQLDPFHVSISVYVSE